MAETESSNFPLRPGYALVCTIWGVVTEIRSRVVRAYLLGVSSAVQPVSVVGMNRAGARLDAEREGAAREGGPHVHDFIYQVLRDATSML